MQAEVTYQKVKFLLLSNSESFVVGGRGYDLVATAREKAAHNV